MLDIDILVESDGLYRTTFPDGRSFTWRLLTLKEYRVFRALREGGVMLPIQLHEKVFERCYLGNPDFIDGTIPGGWTPSIGELIMWVSGDCTGMTEKDDLDIARATYPASSLVEYQKRTILQAFSSYTPDDLDDWTRPVLLRRFVIAENLLVEKQHPYEPLDMKNILTPQQQQKRAARERSNPSGIDFAAENAGLDSAVGPGGDRHVTELAPDEFARKMKIAEKMSGGGRRRRR